MKINHLEKKNIDVDSPKEDHKEFIKNNKFMSKTQQRLISEKHIFNKKNKQTGLNSNDDKRI